MKKLKHFILECNLKLANFAIWPAHVTITFNSGVVTSRLMTHQITDVIPRRGSTPAWTRAILCASGFTLGWREQAIDERKESQDADVKRLAAVSPVAEIFLLIRRDA